MTSRRTRDGWSSANTADHQPPIEFETSAADPELEPVEDISEERVRVSCEIDAVVVERIGKTVAGTVDRERAMASGEQWHKGHPLVRSVTPSVHEENRVAVTELEYLRFPF
jgi:hypothetical protein